MTATTPTSGFTYPTSADIPNGATHLQALAEQVDELLVARFASTAARDAANPTPQDGQLCFITNLGEYQHRRNGLWVSLRTMKNRKLTSDSSRTSTTVLATETALNIPLEANATYIAEYNLFFTGDSGVDGKFQIPGPAGNTTMIFWTALPVDAVTNQTGTIQHGGQTINTSTSFGLFGGTGILRIKMLMKTSATAGDATFQWAQNTASVLSTVMKAGSSVVFRKVS